MNIVLFDLDDTLYKEIDYLKSAFKEISESLAPFDFGKSLYKKMIDLYLSKNDVFNYLTANYKDTSKVDLIEKYRNHFPNISLEKDTITLLTKLSKKNIQQGLITDGYSITQRNKIKALGLNNWIEVSNIIISEEFGSSKPDIKNYEYFEKKYGKSRFLYIGDNTSKDFVSPNLLGWTTICILDNGENIHKQNFLLEEKFLPKHKINNILSVIDIL